MGKGDKRRPLHCDPEDFAERWERTFGCAVSVTGSEMCHKSDTDGGKCPRSVTGEEADRE